MRPSISAERDAAIRFSRLLGALPSRLTSATAEINAPRQTVTCDEIPLPTHSGMNPFDRSRIRRSNRRTAMRVDQEFKIGFHLVSLACG